jgi:HSP20 family protein
MLLTSFDPFAEFQRALRTADSGHAPMRMDAIRRESEVEFRFDLPGIDTDSINVTVDRGVLTVTAQRAEEYADAEKPFIRERVMGSFTRRIRLSDSVDAGNISAAYDRGVLRVSAPLLERAQPRKIEVSTTARAAVGA